MLSVLSATLQKGMDEGQLETDETSRQMAEFLMVAARGLVYDWCIHDGSYPLRPAMASYIGKLLRCCVKA